MNILIGSSGHSLVCFEISKLINIKISGYYSLNKNNSYYSNIMYLGNDLFTPPINQNLFVAIGDNKIRQKIFLRNLKSNKYFNLIHPKAILSSNIQIGLNVLISAGAIINPKCEFSNGVIINTGSIIEHECIIEEFSHIAPGAVLAGNVKVGFSSFIGANSVIKQGVKVGNNVIVGAGTVVLNDVPDNCTIVGNPGKIIK
jgi:sugar O-acyltransferase (sialic acid O-acetyltransferase NeuD family)